MTQMVRGHDSERAATIYQHEARGADAAITSAIDAHPGRARSGGPARRASGTLMGTSATVDSEAASLEREQPLTWEFV